MVYAYLEDNMDTLSFSLDNLKRRIYDPKTRKNFDEIYKCYVNGCCRSAMVMLWSVVVCDLLFKLQEMIDIYSDEPSKKIINDIKEEQIKNPYSSLWEKNILEEVYQKTHLLDTASKEVLNHIMRIRNMCTHPVLNDNNQLYEPTADLTRGYIIASVNYLLAKPPFLSQKITSTLLKDIESIKNIFPDDKSFKIYLNSKYFSALKGDDVAKVFRDLWRIVFNKNNDDTIKNRDINYRALIILYDKEKNIINDEIQQNQSIYSNILTDDDIIEKLILFLSIKPMIYRALSTATQQIIRKACEVSLNNFAVAFFLSESETPENHLKDVIGKIKSSSIDQFKNTIIGEQQFELIENVCLELDRLDIYRELKILYYVISPEYIEANRRFYECIEPYSDSYTEQELIILLEGINSNSQIYGRGKFSYDDKLVIEKAMQKYPNISLMNYDNLKNRLPDI